MLTLIAIGLAIFGVKVARLVLVQKGDFPELPRPKRSAMDLKWWNRKGSDLIVHLEGSHEYRVTPSGNWYNNRTGKAIEPASRLEATLDAIEERIEQNRSDDNINDLFEYRVVSWYPKGTGHTQTSKPKDEWQVVIRNGESWFLSDKGVWYRTPTTSIIPICASIELTEALNRQMPYIQEEYQERRVQLLEMPQ